jgi:hypothetical protein
MRTEKEFLIRLAQIIGELSELILRRLQFLEHTATGFEFSQIGDNMTTPAPITGAAPGASCRIVETPVPAGGLLQNGSALTWSVDGSDVTLAPSADGTSVVCAIAATSTRSAFNLSLAGTNSAGAAISGNVSVPIQQPAAVPATGFSFSQAPV